MMNSAQRSQMHIWVYLAYGYPKSIDIPERALALEAKRLVTHEIALTCHLPVHVHMLHVMSIAWPPS